MSIWIWTGIIIFCLIFEFITVGDLITIWFAISGIFALFANILGANDTIQILIFIILAFILIISLRKICLKVLSKQITHDDPNSLTGHKVQLIEPITSKQNGTGKYNGTLWECKSEDGSSIKAGEIVYIVKTEGNKLIVKK